MSECLKSNRKCNMCNYFIIDKLTIKPRPWTHPAITLSESKKCGDLVTVSQQNTTTSSEACNVPISYCHQTMTCRSPVFLLHGENFGLPNKEKKMSRYSFKYKGKRIYLDILLVVFSNLNVWDVSCQNCSVVHILIEHL